MKPLADSTLARSSAPRIPPLTMPGAGDLRFDFLDHCANRLQAPPRPPGSISASVTDALAYS
ncbi:hypothetical protein LMG26696_02566 [Achromobacter pulmonis]|nr:hypothetical protein LMG26696_02566 [Achromobacter pulmonis]